ncbi:Hint domain-containing protein [Nocardia ignorata]|uniref:Intein n=1 Tax=Nocardia ignorata TaxID=145285 RepID=A0A4R6P0I2_NOCIG|nr:Hint domain-containing protein [Nocardia ignorata]TDP29772.1 intein [Nocardia ignorata]
MTLAADAANLTSRDPINKGSIDVTSDGATVNNVVVDGPINDDWTAVFALFNLNAAEFEVVDDTVRMSTWQQSKATEDGTRDAIQLYSYSARFRRRKSSDIAPETLTAWRDALRAHPLPTPAPRRHGSTYVILVADPQLGKKGTEEAVANWRRGVEAHLTLARFLAPELAAVHVAFMGDETEGVCNNYCVGADELVLTKDMRWVPAGTLQAGDELYTVEEERKSAAGRRYETGRVLANEVRDLPSVRVHFSDGTSLLCTAEHPVLARTGKSGRWKWVRADRLMDYDYEVSKLADPWETAESFEAGWMSGLFDGEGCLQAAAGREPWHLNVSQLPGPVLEKAKRILSDHKFAFREDTNSKSQVATLHLLGGYAEVLRALGTFQPVRLLPKVGHPYVRTMNNVQVMSVEEAGVLPIAVMGTTSRTYIANGIVSHNTNQPHTVELNMSRQLELDFDLRVWTIKEAASLGLPLSVSSVISNHGEWTRNGSKDPVTTQGDNASTHIARQTRKLFDELAEHGAAPAIDWHIGAGDPAVTLRLSGVDCYFSHGYIEKGRGSSSETRTRNAIERQILGRTGELGATSLFFTAHYHHFYSQEFEGRTLFGCPALEAERSSEYMLNQYGVWSPAGMLGLMVGAHNSRGWSNVNVF